MSHNSPLFDRPSLKVHVIEPGTRARSGWMTCHIGRNISFSTGPLESYCIAQWEPVFYDALVIAAAVEFADRTQRRSSRSWQRDFAIVVPVHELERWTKPEVFNSLTEALTILTGDRWSMEFCERHKPFKEPRQRSFPLPSNAGAVIPFSDGMDSRCVAGILGEKMGDRLIRVRLGSKVYDGHALARRRQPFTSIPYRVRADKRQFVESSARSRGFKFALISALSAYLVKAGEVIVPESGQGALGPALVTVGQGYEDYRSHPVFTEHMEHFIRALLGHDVRFRFTQLWLTKAETLRKFVEESKDGAAWSTTWSCWQQTRQVSVAGKKRQCGICAACLLRRMSVHGAGLTENPQTYVWENLSASTFEAGAAAGFPKVKITKALREYAIAGVLHLEHLAKIRYSSANASTLKLTTFKLSRALNLAADDVRVKLDRMLSQHEKEWKDFMGSLGQGSFLRKWASEVPS